MHSNIYVLATKIIRKKYEWTGGPKTKYRRIRFKRRT